MGNGENKKYGTVAIVIGLLFFAVCDLTSFPVIKWFANGIMEYVAKEKSGKSSLSFGKILSRFGLSSVPLPIPNLSGTFIMEVLKTNHPEFAKTAGKLAGKAIGAGLGGPVGAKIGGAAGTVAGGGSLKEATVGAVSMK